MDGIIVLYGLMGGVNVDGPLLAMILGMSTLITIWTRNRRLSSIF